MQPDGQSPGALRQASRFQDHTKGVINSLIGGLLFIISCHLSHQVTAIMERKNVAVLASNSAASAARPASYAMSTKGDGGSHRGCQVAGSDSVTTKPLP